MKNSFLTLEIDVFRAVEGQSYISTRQLVDSDAEQEVLEELIESVKPDYPLEMNGTDDYHYLLRSPFRYPPLDYGSRFGTKEEPSIWYGSKDLFSALHEIAFYRFLFIEQSEAEFEKDILDYSIFSVEIFSEKGLDLTDDPFKKDELEISNPLSYEFSQDLGKKMRENEVEIFIFRSARSEKLLKNIGIFSIGPFKSKNIDENLIRPYTMFVDAKEGVLSIRDTVNSSQEFERDYFLVDGKFPLV